MIEDQQNTSNYYLDPFGYLNNSQQYHYFGVESISQNMLIENQQQSSRQQNCAEEQQSIVSKSKQITQQRKIKQKMKIKRQKAKIKYYTNNQSKQSKSSDSISNKLKYIQHSNTNLKQQELRRKKRASAQMSRDKKKQYIKDIQKQNQELKLRCRQLELENQQLKKSEKSYFNFDFNFDFDFGFDWNLFSEFKRSIKSWFIMGLILFSIQRQSQQDTFTTVINQKYNNNYFENMNTNIHSIIDQYKKSPVQQRIIHLDYFKQLNDLDMENEEQQHITTKTKQIYFNNKQQNSIVWDQCLKYQSTLQNE